MAPLLSIVIATYNRAATLRHCLEALRYQTAAPDNGNFEVVVIDDGSTDATQSVVQEYKTYLPLFYERIRRAGPAVARNEGIRHSRGDILLFIDSDIVASPQLVSEHLGTHKRRADVVVTGPSIWVSSLERLPRRARLWDLSTAPFAAGNASVRKEHALKAGLFDESFTELGWEDIEFGIRLKKLGLRVFFNPRAVAYHYKPVVPDYSSVVDYACQQGRMAVRFFKKHPTLEVALATGLNPWAMAIDRLASLGDWDLRIATTLYRLATRRRWGWISRVAAKQVYNRYYFKALRATLASAGR